MARLLRQAFLPLSLLVLLTAGLVVPLPWYVEAPGGLVDLADAVDVRAPGAEPINGEVFFTTVSLTNATVVSVLAAAVRDDAGLRPRTQVVRPGVREREFFSREREVFRLAGEIAAAVALRAAGYDVGALEGEGVLVVQVLPDTPAAGVLRPGDVIVEVAGRRVTTVQDLLEAVADRPLDVRFLREGTAREVTLTPVVGAVEGVDRPLIGIEPQTHRPRLDLPFAVELDSRDVGGPSAGLMTALAVYDIVSDADVVAGRRIAGTGTLDLDGVVGPVGGVEQKVVAAARHDVDLFLVPGVQVEQAREVVPAETSLQVVAVETFDDALDALRTDGP